MSKNKKWEVWLDAWAHCGGPQVLATHRWKWVAELHARSALQSFKGYVASVTVRERDYTEHVFTYEYVNGGVQYHCSCGWSSGWVEGATPDAALAAAQRVNEAAHLATREQRLAHLEGES